MNRLLDRFRWWHLYHHGHSIRVNRHITIGVMDRSRGWLYTCECGRTWAR